MRGIGLRGRDRDDGLGELIIVLRELVYQGYRGFGRLEGNVFGTWLIVGDALVFLGMDVDLWT